MTENTKNFDIDEIANLARLQIKDEDKEKLRANMLEIVGYIEELSNLNLSGVKPMYHSTEINNVFREDIPSASFPREIMMSIAPSVIDNEFIKVPAVLPEEEQ